MRKPRRIVEFARYHVVARANCGEFILLPQSMKKLFLETISRAKRRYSFSIENFCIMNNHIHLIIIPHGRSSLSRIMQWILGVFATRFNRIYRRKGHVWYDRFKSSVIATVRQFISAFEYVAANPVKARLAPTPLGYPFSGVRHLRDGCYMVVDPPGDLVRLIFPEYAQVGIAKG